VRPWRPSQRWRSAPAFHACDDARNEFRGIAAAICSKLRIAGYRPLEPATQGAGEMHAGAEDDEEVTMSQVFAEKRAVTACITPVLRKPLARTAPADVRDDEVRRIDDGYACLQNPVCPLSIL